MSKFKFRIILLHKKHVFRGIAAVVIGIMAIIGSKPSVEAVFNQNEASKKKLPIYSVDTDEPKVALSFNAAWGAV